MESLLWWTFEATNLDRRQSPPEWPALALSDNPFCVEAMMETLSDKETAKRLAITIGTLVGVMFFLILASHLM